MNLVFMGTPEIAAKILRTIIESGKHNVEAVVTQTDKPKGRGHEMAMSEVKQVAMEYNIPVLQPNKASDPEFLDEIRNYKPDAIIVAAYGKILKQSLLDIPKFGCINVHASLLPKYRGAAPIQWAVINGEEKTGVTIMHMDAGIDTGDIILQKEVSLSEMETAGTLHDKLAELGGEAIVEALEQIASGVAMRIPQVEADSTYVSIIDKNFGKIDFGKEAVKIERLIRGLNPWPTAFTFLDGKILKIWEADVVADYDMPKDFVHTQHGTVVEVTKDAFFVSCGEGVLKVNSLQIEGKKRMNTGDFLRGYTVSLGTVLGR